MCFATPAGSAPPRCTDSTAARIATVGVLLLACLAATPVTRLDRRVVDVVTAGDARSEREHAFAAEGATTGVTGGRTFRQTGAWMRYALNVFDDTEVTVACTLLGADGVPLAFELVVEGQVVATRTLTSASATPSIVEVRVPFVITRGRTNILVTIRATHGLTPALLEMRTIQDHLEH